MEYYVLGACTKGVYICVGRGKIIDVAVNAASVPNVVASV